MEREGEESGESYCLACMWVQGFEPSPLCREAIFGRGSDSAFESDTSEFVRDLESILGPKKRVAALSFRIIGLRTGAAGRGWSTPAAERIGIPDLAAPAGSLRRGRGGGRSGIANVWLAEVAGNGRALIVCCVRKR